MFLKLFVLLLLDHPKFSLLEILFYLPRRHFSPRFASLRPLLNSPRLASPNNFKTCLASPRFVLEFQNAPRLASPRPGPKRSEAPRRRFASFRALTRTSTDNSNCFRFCHIFSSRTIKYIYLYYIRLNRCDILLCCPRHQGQRYVIHVDSHE